MVDIQITMPPQSVKPANVARQSNQSGGDGDTDSFANLLSASRQGDVTPSTEAKGLQGSKESDESAEEDAANISAISTDFISDAISLLGIPATPNVVPVQANFPCQGSTSYSADDPELQHVAASEAVDNALPATNMLPDVEAFQAQASLQPAAVPTATAGANEKMRAARVQAGLGAAEVSDQREPEMEALATRKSGNGLSPPKVAPGTNDTPRDAVVDLPAVGDRGAEPMNTFAVTAHPARHVESAGTEPAATRFVASHVESPSWNKDFGLNVIRLTTEGRSTAEIHLNPPDWGPIHISLKMDGDDASLKLVAEHPGTREALNAAIPHLRELFQVGGMHIVDAAVAAEGQSPNWSGSDTGGFSSDSRPAPAIMLSPTDPLEAAAVEMAGNISILPAGRQVDLFA